MATPAQHAEATTTFLEDRYTNGMPVFDFEQSIAEIHAQLAIASGAGEHYAAADSWLTKAIGYANGQGSSMIREAINKARIHATLAER